MGSIIGTNLHYANGTAVCDVATVVQDHYDVGGSPAGMDADCISKGLLNTIISTYRAAIPIDITLQDDQLHQAAVTAHWHYQNQCPYRT